MEIRPRYKTENIAGVKAHLKEKLYNSGSLAMSDFSIFKVPIILSRHRTKAYSPNAFSFGPFHHNEKELKPTENIKCKYLHDLISRLSNPNYTQHPKDPDTILSTLTEAVHKVYKEAKGHYAGPINMKEDELVEVLVLDGCFIIEFFRKKGYEDLREKNDPIFSMSCLLQFLSHDLILLENQIPWLVLDVLFKSTTTSIDKKYLVELVIENFRNIFSSKPLPIAPFLPDPESKHILDLLRESLVWTSSTKEHGKQFEEEPRNMRSATDLDNFGIKFKKRDNAESILDIDFDETKGELKIPPLLIQETTETVFRNLISLEQCCPNYEPIITSYAVLLDNLINTKEDVELLRRNGAISTWLNVGEATKSFNNLYIDTYLKESFYHNLTRKVDEYCQGRWNRYLRALKRDYFKHPWALISVIAVSIGLILSFLQTLFTIMD